MKTSWGWAALALATLLLVGCGEEGEIIEESGAVTIRGEVVHSAYASYGSGPFRMAVYTRSDFDAGNTAHPLAETTVVGADVSPYEMRVPGDSGRVVVTAINDANLDGDYQPDQELRGAAPVYVADQDVGGVDFGLWPYDLVVNDTAHSGTMPAFGDAYYMFFADSAGGTHTITVSNMTTDTGWELYTSLEDMLMGSAGIEFCSSFADTTPESCTTSGALTADTPYFLLVSENDNLDSSFDVQVTYP